MTISTSASQTTVMGNGSTVTFTFDFVADSSDFIVVSYTDANGTLTTLDSSAYTLIINPPAVGQIWGVGGSVTYPLSGSPIADGTFITISRVLPYTQTITISNQGDFAPQVIEEMGDTLEMQIQQLSARTTQFRGVWITDTDYIVGDIVQDGADGFNTNNYYICQVANTSDIWGDDLAAGDWAISVLATVPSSGSVITLTGDVTGSSAVPVATTLATVNSNVGSFSNVTVNAKGLITAAGNLTGDATSSGSAITLATVNSNVGSFAAANITVNAKGLITAASNGSSSKITTYQVTDSTDIALSIVTTQANVGSTQSIIIPTKGEIQLDFFGEVIGTTQEQNVTFGIRIGSTNYYATITNAGTTYYFIGLHDSTGTTTVSPSGGAGQVFSSGSNQTTTTYNTTTRLNIQQLSIPTGTQTVQAIAARNTSTGTCTLKGTVVPTIIGITVIDRS